VETTNPGIRFPATFYNTRVRTEAAQGLLLWKDGKLVVENNVQK
jgi:hypothetical protein